ncbi:MlaD family protein [Gordonia jinhuaensis]|uniref:ABC transporter substrate-binding protein n=1 Tax=Gordonia jinhuaensis TaxID=1517702 RepID=A0A916WVE8_9ACTN|nr:MCE family protein [Gordonia jinhuaensis]GGB33754.1 ABC transporter substrate-binding protein [Gordonia jinhuaensis]
MISRLAKWQLVIFAIVGIVAIVYAALTYVQVGRITGLTVYTVKADFKDSGGIFTNAEVTYQGVPVGRVGQLHLTSDGVRADLDLNSSGPKIPASAMAVVANRSAVGEQFVDLRPKSAQGPYLKSGSLITDTQIPTPLDDVIKSAIDLSKSVPVDDLHTVVTELSKGIGGQGENLSKLVDSLSNLSKAGLDNLPATISLLRNSDTALTTQADQSDEILSWSKNINLVARQLSSSDPDIRRLLTTGALSATQLSALLERSGGDITTVVRDLAADVRETAPTYFAVGPLLSMLAGLSAGSYSTAPGDGTIHFGVVLETNNPPTCTYGYEGTTKMIDEIKAKNPDFDINYDDFPFNTNANCQVAQGNPTDVRGAKRAVLANPNYAQPWDSTPKKAPDALNLNPIATQLSALLGVRPAQ